MGTLTLMNIPCRSVDGKVRCYDLRMGQLRVDAINSNFPLLIISKKRLITHTSLLEMVFP